MSQIPLSILFGILLSVFCLYSSFDFARNSFLERCCLHMIQFARVFQVKICFISLVHLYDLGQSCKPSEPSWESKCMEILIVICAPGFRMSGKRERRGSNLFKDSWLSDNRFSSWLQKEFTLIYTIDIKCFFSCIKLNYTM